MIRWLKANVFKDGMPRSFAKQKDWRGIGEPDTVEGVIERIIINNGLSIYDGATWQIALAVDDIKANKKAADVFTNILSSGSWGALETIRGYREFKYQGKSLPKENAYFFRIISPLWQQPDPLDGKTHIPRYPGPGYDRNLIVWVDWKPITGENAWVIIGSLQTAYKKYGGKVPLDCNEFRLAESIIPAMEALQIKKMGAILHAPEGTHGKHPNEISTENELSAYAALRMLHKVTNDSTDDSKYDGMMQGLENYFVKHSLDENNNIFYQGGKFIDNEFTPNPTFAVDCQTWGIAVLTPEIIDTWFKEDKEDKKDGLAYEIWENTKKRAGYYDEKGILRGVGFSDGHDILSAEWTAGAIFAAYALADYYKDSRGRQAANDARTMREGINELKAKINNQGIAYYYANKRYKIPFSWWANRILSTTSTAWVYFVDKRFNPFFLGGKM